MSDNDVLTSYSGVRLSSEEAASLVQNEGWHNDADDPQVNVSSETGEQPAPEPASQETDQPEVTEVERSEDLGKPDGISLDGKEYTSEDIQTALDALSNKTEWQKSNTEKAQELAAERKAIQAEREVWSKLRDNEDAMDALGDLLEDDHPIFSEPKVDQAIKDTSQDTEEPSRLQEIEDKLNEIVNQRDTEKAQVEADKQVSVDLATLKQNHPELEDGDLMDSVIQTAIEKGFTGINGLEDAFVLTYHNSAENSAFKSAVKRARNAKAAKAIPETDGAVKGVHSEPISKPASYKEAKADALKNYNFYE
jgi:hypothetical protein